LIQHIGEIVSLDSEQEQCEEQPLIHRKGFTMFFDTTLHTRLRAHLSDPGAVAAFWKPLGHAVWFGKDPVFDQAFREAFKAEHGAAARGELMPWLATPEGALSLILLLDQYPRNAFRGTPRMYDTDTLGRQVADAALGLGHDAAVAPSLRVFFYLPFGHSELLPDQDRAVDLCAGLPDPAPAHARNHRDIIARFGRFPHRNALLGRPSKEDEADWLADGGFAG
jgi:uncharacterized protein (DUF924 family)